MAAGKPVRWDPARAVWYASVEAPPSSEPLPRHCPRCLGRVDVDAYGDVGCLNCGWVRPPARLARAVDDGELAPRAGKLRRRHASHSGQRL